ncbi:MAG: zinc ribbon domain-containing protein [Vicinamibacteraceae bacterium]|nr:zinc ribbon domain-containing protein [Vicinamibacteraceae bacterium]
MPIYEFRCRACRRKTTSLVLVRSRIDEVRCTHCGGADLERLWSRFATPRSEEARLDRLADEAAFGGLDESDPRAMMDFMKRMGRELGEDLGDDVEAAMEEELAASGPEGEAGGGPDGGAEDGFADGPGHDDHGGSAGGEL